MEIIKRKLVVWGALAWASILEAIRRKDIYVALILSVIMILAAATIGTFGVAGLEMFLKDVALTVISVLSLVMTVLFAARQIPEEVSRRTVYPLLARPIGRGDLIFGKFLGAYALSVVALLLFSTIAVGALAVYGLTMGAIFWQFLLLRVFALGLICAMTMALSLVMTPGATVTMALLLTAGASTFSNAVLLLYGGADAARQTVLKASYYVFPHLDLFDLKAKVSYGWKPIDSQWIGLLFVYAALYVALFLSLGVWRFRKQAL